MIREHEFNTRWWGRPVGLITDKAFFKVSRNAQLDLLSHYDWVECSMALSAARPLANAMHSSGFMQADTQVNFRINMRKAADSNSMQDLQTQFADEHTFSLDEASIADFTHERFSGIPGATQERVNQRFSLWGKELIAAHPGYCLQVLHNGQIQGWFLSQASEKKGVNLTLAMLSSKATISGMYVYRKALVSYAKRGHSLGWASFSITNTAVHNIYTNLGARFIEPRGNWLWLA